MSTITLSVTELDELERLQQRILMRTALAEFVLQSPHFALTHRFVVDPVENISLVELLQDLLLDIREAAAGIGGLTLRAPETGAA